MPPLLIHEIVRDISYNSQRLVNSSSSVCEPTPFEEDNNIFLLPIARKKNVTFSDECSTWIVPLVASSDKHKVWYSIQEYGNINDSLVVTAKAIHKGQYRGDDDELCARGLEYKLPTYSAQQHRNRRQTALKIVLDEQERQRSIFSSTTVNVSTTGVLDPEQLAFCYEKASLPCRQLSALLGSYDAKEAARLQKGKDSLTVKMCRHNKSSNSSVSSLSSSQPENSSTARQSNNKLSKRKSFTKNTPRSKRKRQSSSSLLQRFKRRTVPLNNSSNDNDDKDRVLDSFLFLNDIEESLAAVVVAENNKQMRKKKKKKKKQELLNEPRNNNDDTIVVEEPADPLLGIFQEPYYWITACWD
eukprot:CAMPEP_0194208796 /NCGR_PEP_ID=MMETSP0156-20130528/7138_1 /TAXON_ID=33649 /ORGANISM="Thalassionema nitzschioides, Strain L26-B" /LENGTH=356 /DNA_ID=CAMNT_0038935833 /DNA_START=30 /DNA_END=1100 /DNA_ORIENTATION=+